MRFFLCKRQELEAPVRRRFRLPDGRELALFATPGGAFVIENRCPHAGSRLDDGLLEGTQLTCIWHGHKFDLRSGSCLDGEAGRLHCFQVEIEGEDVFVRWFPRR